VAGPKEEELGVTGGDWGILKEFRERK